MTIFPARHNGTTDGPYPVTSQANATLTAPQKTASPSDKTEYEQQFRHKLYRVRRKPSHRNAEIKGIPSDDW